MDIQLTEEQELLRASLQRLLRDQYGFDARRKIVATDEGWSRKHWASFAELGLLAAPFSEEAGGLGGGPLATMIVMQEFGRHLVVEPFFETVILCGSLIEHFGSGDQKRQFIPDIIAGNSIWALAWTEGQVSAVIGQEVELEYQPSSPRSSVGLRYMRCVGCTFGITTGPRLGWADQRA